MIMEEFIDNLGQDIPLLAMYPQKTTECDSVSEENNRTAAKTGSALSITVQEGLWQTKP